MLFKDSSCLGKGSIFIAFMCISVIYINISYTFCYTILYYFSSWLSLEKNSMQIIYLSLNKHKYIIIKTFVTFLFPPYWLSCIIPYPQKLPTTALLCVDYLFVQTMIYEGLDKFLFCSVTLWTGDFGSFDFPYLTVYKTGFPLFRMTLNNLISPMKFCYNTSFKPS